MECSRCGAEIHRRLTVCPVCGAQLRTKPQKVRCRYCGYRSSAELILCPRCGRERRPGGVSSAVWIGGVALIALVVAGWIGLPPLGGLRATLADRVPGGSDLTALMNAILPTVESIAALSTPEPTSALEAASVDETDLTPAIEPSLPTDTPTPEATPTPTVEPPTPTPAVTETSTPTPTAALAGEANIYLVEPGDTLSTIARRFGVTVEAIARANNIKDVAQLQVGQRLVIPPTGEELPTPSAPSEAGVYVVAPGDTPSSIARRFGITVEELMRANNIRDASRLQVNQRLIIPKASGASAAPILTPTPAPTATPTPTAALVYPAPQLLSPSDNTPFSGGDQAFIELRWQDVGPLQPGEVYVVHLGYLVAPDQISWFYEDMVQGTSWRVPGVFQSYAPQEMGRAFRWYVQVEQIRRDADGRIVERIPRSPRSALWGFSWR